RLGRREGSDLSVGAVGRHGAQSPDVGAADRSDLRGPTAARQYLHGERLMPDFQAFVGPSYNAASYRADVEDTRNWLPQTVESGGRVAARFLNPTPGFTNWASTGLAPIRATFAQ